MRLTPGSRAKAMTVAILAGVCLVSLGAAELKIPPSPERWATDTAGFLSPATVQEVDRTLETYEQQSGHQIIVYIGKTTEGYPIEEFATKAFQAWRVGRKGLDDGLVLFIMAEDRKIRIEVGYGLEATVPDIIAGRIINDVMVPRIRAGDPDGAVREAVGSIIQTISGTPPAAGPGQEPGSPAGASRGKHTAESIFIAIAAILFLILFITNPSLALWLLFNIMGGGGRGGGRGGGWGGGGGGFSGGGGRSGGGGASGGW